MNPLPACGIVADVSCIPTESSADQDHPCGEGRSPPGESRGWEGDASLGYGTAALNHETGNLLRIRAFRHEDSLFGGPAHPHRHGHMRRGIAITDTNHCGQRELSPSLPPGIKTTGPGISSTSKRQSSESAKDRMIRFSPSLRPTIAFVPRRAANGALL